MFSKKSYVICILLNDFKLDLNLINCCREYNKIPDSTIVLLRYVI